MTIRNRLIHIAEFRRRSPAQRLAAKRLGARRRGKTRSKWKGLALASGGAATALATIAATRHRRRKQSKGIPLGAPSSTIASPKKQGAVPPKSPAGLLGAAPKGIGGGRVKALPPDRSRKKQNSARTERRLDYLVGNAGKGKTGRYRSRETMLKDFRLQGKTSKGRAKQRRKRNSRIDAARKRNVNYSRARIALASFARARQQ